jgi:hypothetical protein
MALKRIRILLFSLICCLLHSSAFAEEKIANFVSNTKINKNGTADVTENITIISDGQRPIHGFVRWMPGYYRDADNTRFKIRYFFSPPLVNGLPAVYRMIYGDGSMGYYLGSEKNLLPPGRYTYTLHYRVLNAITYGVHTDQFYWNITGNFWKLAIDNVDASIKLPPGVTTFDFSGYTGDGKAHGHDFFVSKDRDTPTIDYVTTRNLLPGEGLTIALQWPKGFVIVPGWKQRIYSQFFYQYGNKVSVCLTLVLFVYFAWAWFREAKTSASGTLPPVFMPPKTLSPSGMRFITSRFDMKIFSTAIVDMAAKGYLTIEQNKDESYTLVRVANSNADLTRGEKAAVLRLFAGSDSITIAPDNRLVLTAAKRSLKKSLRTEFESIYFMTHAIYILPGILLSMLAIIALAYSTHDYQDVFLLGCILLFALTYLSNRLPAMSELIREFVQKPTFKVGSHLLGGSILLAVMVIIAGMLINPLTDVLTFKGLFMLALIIYMNILFYHLMRARAPQGRRLMDQVQGFKDFLTSEDQAELEKYNPPVKTPELYEKYLPYAIALGVENNWAAQFINVKNSAAQTNPGWYEGNWDASNPAAFVVSLSKALGSSIYSGPADRRRK